MQDRSFTGAAVRFCGLKFVEMTRAQQDGLDKLLEECFSS
jgi:hypothetical protein